MKIVTSYPVKVQRTKTRFSNAEGGKAKMSPEQMQQLGQLGTQLAGTFINRQLSNVEQNCGKRPVLPGRKRDEWNQCAQRFQQSGGAMTTPSYDMNMRSMAPSSESAPSTTPTSDEKKKKTIMWVAIGGGVVVLGVVLYFVMKKKK